MTATTELRSYDEIGAVTAALTRAFNEGQLTAEMLTAAVAMTAFAGYETMPSSIGLDWLRSQFEPIETAYMRARQRTRDDDLERIQEITADRDAQLSDLVAKLPNMTRVFMSDECLASRWSTHVLCSTRFFGLIEEYLRGNFFHQVLARHNPGMDWAKAALAVGLPREFLVRETLTKLERTTIDPEDTNTPNFVTDFLRHGAWQDGDHYWAETPEGRELRRRPSVWSLFTKEELTQAMGICVDKVPGKFLERRGFNEPSLIEKLEQEIDPSDVKALLIRAVRACGSLDYVDADAFGRLSLATRVQLIDELPGNSLELLVRTVAELPPGDDEAFFMKHVYPTTQRGWRTIVDQYIRLQSTLDSLADWMLADVIRQVIENNLKGTYLVGTVKRGTHPKGGMEYQVQAGGKTYVQQKSGYTSDTYCPVAGDTVIFPRRGRALSSKTGVIAVTFQRVRKAAKKPA